jgi:hypothetical protein
MPDQHRREAVTIDWDYFPLYLKSGMTPSEMQEQLQELGRKGWDLVAVAPYSTGASELVAFLKRPLEKPESDEQPVSNS